MRSLILDALDHDPPAPQPPVDAPVSDMVACVSYGGGVNSVAVLVLLQRMGIVPAAIVMADPGSERRGTISFRDEVLPAWLDKVGFPRVTVINRITEGQHVARAWRLETLYDECARLKSLPSVAYGWKKCSAKYKGDTQRWWVARQPWALAEWEAGRKISKIIGYDADEGRRVLKAFQNPWEDARFVPRYPLVEAGIDREGCLDLIRDAGMEPPPKSACTYCLAGTTEVVTRSGIHQIKDLVDGTHALLVPAVGTHGGLGHRGGFKPCVVKSYGAQFLWELKLARGRQSRTELVTAEHRWFLAAAPHAQWKRASTYERTTATLRPGDRLKTLRATAPAKEQLMPAAVAQGFTYGDGSRLANDDRPASLTIYNIPKDRAVLKFFGLQKPPRSGVHNAKPKLDVYGLPRFWKDLPPIEESRSFLLSWLAGYFAADGSVSKDGAAILESADPRALDFVRSAAAVCGVGYGAVRKRMRVGIRQKEASALYRVSLRVEDLPEWFFLIANHRRNVKKVKHADFPWVVQSVRRTGRQAEVFCATVPGIGAFGLSEDLMTGNCPNNTLEEWEELRREEPDKFAEAVAMSRNAADAINSPDVVGLMRCNVHGKRQLHVWAEGGYGDVTRGGREDPMPCECAL